MVSEHTGLRLNGKNIMPDLNARFDHLEEHVAHVPPVGVRLQTLDVDRDVRNVESFMQEVLEINRPEMPAWML